MLIAYTAQSFKQFCSKQKNDLSLRQVLVSDIVGIKMGIK